MSEKQCELQVQQLQQQRLPQQPALPQTPPSSPEQSKELRCERKGRQCDACRTTETPMWRRGPGGKGTLCNACGVRWSLRKKRPRPGQEGADAGGEVLSPELSDPATSSSMMDDEATDPAIAALRSKRESDKQDYYYCRYCDKTWPLNYFRNSQQFGAHCSNCSRKKRPAPGETEGKPKRERSGRSEHKKAKRERERARETVVSVSSTHWSGEGGSSSSPAAATSPPSSSSPTSSMSSTSTTSPGSGAASSSPRKRERDFGAGLKKGGALAISKRRAKHSSNYSTDMHSGGGSGSSGADDDVEDEGAWERLFERLKGSAKQLAMETTPATPASAVAAQKALMSEEERRREVELLEKEVTLLRYQVRLKEHWHKKSLKEVKHNMEDELHELQKDLIYSFEVAQACIKLELESNEKEETQVLLAFARQISLPPTPQPQSPQHQHQPDGGSGSGITSATGSTNSSGACSPCHDNLDKLRQDGEQLRKSCRLQLAKLKTELEHQFSAKEETFMSMLRETKGHFSSSTLRLRKKISEIESLIRTLRVPSDMAAVQSSDDINQPADPAPTATTCS